MTDVQIQLAVFIITSAFIVFYSRRSLSRPASHGFYRFFAWEAILGIIVLNVPSWFQDPFSARQIVSWTLLAASLLVLWLGLSRLRTAKRSSVRTGDDLYPFEKTSELITSGVYGLIRHPLYASLLYLAWGAMLKDITWVTSTAALFAGVSLVATARADERECIEYYGTAYEDYMKQTKMFIPYLF